MPHSITLDLFPGYPADTCICTRVCDCEDPDSDNGVSLVSHHCPIHNENPKPYPECTVKVHYFERRE